MLEWLKYTFGSFFFNKISKEGANRSLWNVIFSLFMLLMILTAFFSTGFNYSFSTHYVKASEYQEFLYDVFANENVDERINIQVLDSKEGEEKKITSFYGNNSSNVAIINTFDNETDKQKYSSSGYNIIVDTRPSDTTFFKFDFKIYEIENEEHVISYEEYRKLENQSDYTSSLEIYNEVVTYTDEDIANYTKFIKEKYIPDISESSDMYQIWKDIDKTEDKTTDYYKAQIYSYYVQAYYGMSVTPTNQYYYQYEYAKYDEKGNYVYDKYIIITDNWLMTSFVNDKNVEVTFDGYYDSFDNGFVLTTPQNANSIDVIKSSVDLFIVGSYASVNSVRSILIGMQIFRYFPTIIIAMAILALFIFCMCKMKNRPYGNKFLGAFKIVSSYLIGASVISGIAVLILAFFVSSNIALSVGLWGLLAILSIRVFVLTIGEEIKYKKDPAYDKNIPVSTIDLDEKDEDYVPNVDLSKVDTGTKIIVNEDDDDDEEKMELM